MESENTYTYLCVPMGCVIEAKNSEGALDHYALNGHRNNDLSIHQVIASACVTITIFLWHFRHIYSYGRVRQEVEGSQVNILVLCSV